MSQALVAVGGKATRLRAALDVPLSKSFLEIDDRPLLYWCLRSLKLAGVTHLVIAADRPELISRAQTVLFDAPFEFRHVAYFKDDGLGVHGLPYHTRHLIDGPVLFQAGHDVAEAEHLDRLFQVYRDERMPVCTAYPIESGNPRPRVGRHALALPMVVDRGYAERLPELGFNIERVATCLVLERRLALVPARGYPEFDTPDEYHRFVAGWSDAS